MIIMNILLFVGFNNKQIRLAIVVLPAPDCPTKAIDLKAGNSKFKFLIMNSLTYQI